MSVDNQTGEDPVGRQQLPDHIRMPWEHRGAPVAEMCRQRRAGGDRVADLLPCRGGVSDGGAHARRDEMFDERQRTRDFRRQRDQRDAAARGVLPSIEVVETRRRHMLARMRAARTVIRRDVRAFHVDAGDRRVARSREHARARRELLE